MRRYGKGIAMGLPVESEAGFTAAVLALARVRGWRCAHFRPARTLRRSSKFQVPGSGVVPEFQVPGSKLKTTDLKLGTLNVEPGTLAAEAATGWRTAVSGDGAGFPDLLLVRAERLVVAELKVGRGQ